MITRIQKLSYAVIACVLLCGCHVTSEENRAATAPFFGFVLDGYPITAQKLTDLYAKTGVYGDFIVFYMQWPAPERTNEAEFPRDTLEHIRSVGATPCLTWEPMYMVKGREVAVLASEICGGRYDDFIRAFARKAADWGKPLLVRFAHEMNLQRYHWGTSEEKYGPESPALYQAMFRHVVDVAREAGGSNLVWVFCSNAESVPNFAYDSNATWNVAANYYPGEKYVDLMGVDGYNWGDSRKQELHGWTSRGQTFEEIFAGPCRDLKDIAPDKPVLVFETASVGTADEKNSWLAKGLDASRGLGISGVAWFQVSKENNWQLTGKIEEIVNSSESGQGRAFRKWIWGRTR